MPRPRPQYLSREKTRHGRFVWYVRKSGKRTRLHAEYGSPEFQAEFEAAIAGTPVAQTRARSGTLAWLYERYQETAAWSGLSRATRRQRENIFAHVMSKSGSEQFIHIRKAAIEAAKNAQRDKPSQARNFLDAMRGLFRWALAADHVQTDPTAGVQNPKRPDGNGFPAWDENDVARFEAHWPAGTRQRVWLHVLLYTGFRRGDAVTAGPQHVRDGVIYLRTEKTGIEVAIHVLPILAETLATGPCADLAFICGERGERLTKESFGNNFSEACRAAGVKKSAHGVRKIAATRMAENGATVAELEALFGWAGGAMASLYTKAANRKRLSIGAAGKLLRTPDQQPIVVPKRPRCRTGK